MGEGEEGNVSQGPHVPKPPERITGSRNFVISHEGKIYFAATESESHPAMARRLVAEGVIKDLTAIKTGGRADFGHCLIHGRSAKFNEPYDVHEVRQIMDQAGYPHWRIESPDTY